MCCLGDHLANRLECELRAVTVERIDVMERVRLGGVFDVVDKGVCGRRGLVFGWSYGSALSSLGVMC